MILILSLFIFTSSLSLNLQVSQPLKPHFLIMENGQWTIFISSILAKVKASTEYLFEFSFILSRVFSTEDSIFSAKSEWKSKEYEFITFRYLPILIFIPALLKSSMKAKSL